MDSPAAERHDWETHWTSLSGDRSLFGALASIVRKVVLSGAVRHYMQRYCPPEGVFVEAGCGTSEASGRIDRRGRRLVGLDFSLEALRHARREGNFDGLVCADIRHLPFRDDQVAGLWNLGVMEHFYPRQCDQILREFHRVLRPRDGTALLFWPPTFGLSRWVLAPFEWLISLWRRKTFHFFPDEVNRLPSRHEAREVTRATGLDPVRVDFTPRDGFNHLIVVARKPPS